VTGWMLFEDVRLVDGRAPEASPPTALLVAGDRVHGHGEVENLLAEVPTAERDHVDRVQGSGRVLMPGLIDAHCHMTYGNSLSQEEQDIYTSVESRTLRAAWNVRRVLRAGVTSISQPGGSWYIGVALREAIGRGMVVGPRMSTAGRYITTSNGLTDWYPDSTGVPDGSIGSLANTPAEMLDNVRHQVKNGVDFIKLADSPMGQYQSFTSDELKLISDLAHQLGRKVTIHARGSAEVKASVDAGIDWIMHGNVMTDDVIEQLAASRIPLVPTLLLLANAADYGYLVGTPPGFADGARRMLDVTGETLHRAHDAGVVFASGTDSGFAITPYGEFHAKELELLMEYAGLSAQEAIAAGTCNAAPTVGLEGRVGTLESGMLADLILVNGDPLRDIRVLQDRSNVEGVFVGGKRIQFDGTEEVAWPNERSMVYATATLTATMVRETSFPPSAGGEEGETVERSETLHGPDGSPGPELVHEVGKAGRRAIVPDVR
jgi:imidazolonepropionase-like amidohydrolase